MSKIVEHSCKRCGKWHSLFYKLHEGGQEHLMYVCTRSHEAFLIPYRAGLPIPHLKSEKLMKLERKKLQPTLL